MKTDKEIPNLNKDAIRHIVVEPQIKLDKFPKIDNEILNKIKDKDLDLKKAIDLLQKASAFIDIIRFECGEDADEIDLEKKINEFLEEVRKKYPNL